MKLASIHNEHACSSRQGTGPCSRLDQRVWVLRSVLLAVCLATLEGPFVPGPPTSCHSNEELGRAVLFKTEFHNETLHRNLMEAVGTVSPPGGALAVGRRPSCSTVLVSASVCTWPSALGLL